MRIRPLSAAQVALSGIFVGNSDMRTFTMIRVLPVPALMLAAAVSFAGVLEAQTLHAPAAIKNAAESAPTNIQQQIRNYFFDAARTGDLPMLKEIIAAKFDLNTRDEKGFTALILAAYHGKDEAVKLLMTAGADPCAADNHGNTALMGAIFKGELGIARELLHAKCNPNQRNAAGQTAAMYAALFGRIEIMQGLKDQGADLQAEDSAGNTAEKLARGEFSRPARN